ncbi:hypothetical protein E2C01_076836 [Portunus trituberculatus]|uniref:Uncharacterized protein n=1 Tax=Portunus trituberculatus TaxID=210409 RepID=A0A5B7IN20_PORTR|nr:hypothetical protein [Portunus trituberculatus]
MFATVTMRHKSSPTTNTIHTTTTYQHINSTASQLTTISTCHCKRTPPESTSTTSTAPPVDANYLSHFRHHLHVYKNWSVTISSSDSERW